MNTELIASLHVREQAHEVIVYHRILSLALALGVAEDRAEVLAASVFGHCQLHGASITHCATQSNGESYLLVIRADNDTWREQVSLHALPDADVLEAQRQLLAESSLPDLLRQMHGRQELLQQQRDALKLEAERLSTKLTLNHRDMEHQAMHDELTGLPNRPLLTERAKHALQIAGRQGFHCCLMVMDLDNFKDINDALGHHIGDLMLQEVANRFKKSLRVSDTLARLGGDEFAVLLLNNSADQAKLVAEKLRSALSKPFELQGHVLSVTISIGITEFPTHGDDISSLMRRADVAMYHAKNMKLDSVVYSPLQDEHSAERLALLNELNLAIQAGQLELYYQPQVLTAGEGLPSLEALIRWPHPEKGMVFPDRFIPLAEDSGLITPMTWWVMETAVAQCAAWHRSGLPVNVSINISAHCLQEVDMAQRIADCIRRHELPDNALVLEITESMIMADPHQASKVLLEIDAMKVDVAIDDFGTGHSSLAYLKHLKVDELKIDRSFVMGMFEHKNDEVIVRTVINMAHSMGLRVVGEGIEDRQSWDALAAMGCDRIQGYFISRPQPVEQMTRWLENFATHGLQLDD